MAEVSVVAPVHNESENVVRFVNRVNEVAVAANLDLEIILVDDGSTDDSWDFIQSQAEQHENVRGVKLSRNFGKDPALYAGLSLSSAPASIVIDSDLQHPPELIPELVAAWKDGHDLVVARKETRPDQSFFVRIGSTTWGGLFQKLTGLDVRNTTDFRLVSARLRRVLLAQEVTRPFFRGDSSALGFPTAVIDFTPASREHGASNFRVSSLAKLAVRSITTFSTKPLHLVSIASIVLMVAALILGVHTIVQWATGNAQDGFPTVILLILVIGSLLLFGLGIIGEYIAAIFEAVRYRAPFIIETDTGASGRDS